MLLVLPHGHKAGAGGEGFVREAALVVGLLGVPLVIVDLLLGLLGIVWAMLDWSCADGGGLGEPGREWWD